MEVSSEVWVIKVSSILSNWNNFQQVVLLTNVLLHHLSAIDFPDTALSDLFFQVNMFSFMFWKKIILDQKENLNEVHRNNNKKYFKTQYNKTRDFLKCQYYWPEANRPTDIFSSADRSICNHQGTAIWALKPRWDVCVSGISRKELFCSRRKKVGRAIVNQGFMVFYWLNPCLKE